MGRVAKEGHGAVNPDVVWYSHARPDSQETIKD
jgi:hypothetical protein